MCLRVFLIFAATSLVSVQTNGHNKAAGSNTYDHLWTQKQTWETLTKRWDETGRSVFDRKRASLSGATLQAVTEYSLLTSGTLCTLQLTLHMYFMMKYTSFIILKPSVVMYLIMFTPLKVLLLQSLLFLQLSTIMLRLLRGIWCTTFIIIIYYIK